MSAPAGFTQVPGTGEYMKSSDGSGPYVFDGTNMALKATGTGGGGGGGGAVTSVDGGIVTIGAIADAAVAAGAAGTLSAKLRTLTSQIAALIAQIPASLGIKTAAASLSVAPASDALFQTSTTAVTMTDKSGTITTGGTAQTPIASNAARKGFEIQNLSTGDLWFSTLAAAVQSQPSVKIAAGQLYETPAGGAGTGAVSLIGATTGQAFMARERT